MWTAHHLVEDFDLYTKTGRWQAMGNFRFNVEIDRLGNWSIDSIDLECGDPLHVETHGHAMSEIIKWSVQHPTNHRHVKALDRLAADVVAQSLPRQWHRSDYDIPRRGVKTVSGRVE